MWLEREARFRFVKVSDVHSVVDVLVVVDPVAAVLVEVRVGAALSDVFKYSDPQEGNSSRFLLQLEDFMVELEASCWQEGGPTSLSHPIPAAK